MGSLFHWHPALLAALLALASAVLLALPPLPILFELTSLNLVEYLLISAAVVWALILLEMWRMHLIERYLQLKC